MVAVRELRTCPITGVTVLINSAWVGEPPVVVPPPAECWFCSFEGRVTGEGDGARAVPHPTPALGIEGDVRMRREGERLWRDAVGAHELIFGAHGGESAAALRLAAARIADLRNDTRFRGLRLFSRRIPGHHAVWQLVALPIDVAPTACTDWRDEEMRAGVRVAGRSDDGGAVALAAFAPRAPFEVWVMAAHGRGDFGRGVLGTVVALADELAARISVALRGAMVDMSVEDGEPCRIVLMPRVAISPAIEIATGLATHGAFPEEVAGWLRR